MSERPVWQPTAEHPITVAPTGRHVTVTVNGVVVAESDGAVTLQESTYPAVQYIPREDVVPTTLVPSETTSYCPYKGEASYFHVADVQDAIWTYAQPYPAVADIAGKVAFYPDKAQISLA
ncbi:DUF427 domain-containing protein [Mycolicibacterium frederiksbergense]|uniref:DUF427 domain-containing protein n=1 Tax=Mycolicibacterium frederiksbergense TaxID=117567 RepID=UPI00265BD7FC|nr:DUF427 domain-containing protein [Mycolicibacterium frederiksbergense]MDO0974135.1 DUF427 domain-containing protein [Mycolicibacterium frederiksbergense]